jgi:hypothetical protein
MLMATRFMEWIGLVRTNYIINELVLVISEEWYSCYSNYDS